MSFIRLATEHDAEQIQAIYSPIVSNTAISFETDPPSVDEMRERIRNTLARFPWLVCEDQSRILGYAYARRHKERAAYQWSVDVSVYVHADARRRGVGRALYNSLFKILTLQGFYTVYAGIALPNPASVGLHESLGFLPIGVYKSVGYKLGAWHDVGRWYLSLRPTTTAPEPPLDLQTVTKSEAWEAALMAGVPFLSG